MVLAGNQKRESDSLGMELQRVVTLSMGSGDRVWVLGRADSALDLRAFSLA